MLPGDVCHHVDVEDHFLIYGCIRYQEGFGDSEGESVHK